MNSWKNNNINIAVDFPHVAIIFRDRIGEGVFNERQALEIMIIFLFLRHATLTVVFKVVIKSNGKMKKILIEN